MTIEVYFNRKAHDNLNRYAFQNGFDGTASLINAIVNDWLGQMAVRDRFNVRYNWEGLKEYALDDQTPQP